MPDTLEIQQTLDEGRAEWAGLATDTCRITRAGSGGRGTFNEATGQYEDKPDRVLVYEGPCRWQVKADINSNVVETTAGDREWTYTTVQLQLPCEPPVNDPRYVGGDPNDVDVDNVFTMLAAPFSPNLVGHVANIAGPYGKSHSVYLRFRIRENVA